jgi:hypothetical protein
MLLLVAMALPLLLSAQDAPAPILTRAFSRTDWELSDIGDARFGRVAVVESPDGPQVELRRLLLRAPVSLPISARSSTPPFDGNNLIVSDFSQGNRTPLGGYFGTFRRHPSTANATVGQGSDQRRVLNFTCQHEDPGFCGVWIQLYDFDAPISERSYLDAREFSTLSFWIRIRH